MGATIKTNIWLNVVFAGCYLIGYIYTVMINLLVFQAPNFGGGDSVGSGWMMMLGGWVLYVPILFGIVVGLGAIGGSVFYACLALRYFNKHTWIGLLANVILLIVILVISLVTILVVSNNIFDEGYATVGMIYSLTLICIDSVVLFFLLKASSEGT